MPEVVSELIHIHNLRFRWPGDSQDTLHIDDFRVRSSENLFVMGASGSGKSTLLNVIGGVCLPQQGVVEVLGKELGRMGAAARDQLRADHIGYIFQQFNLIPYLNAIENIVLPCRFSNVRSRRSVQRSGSVEGEARRLFDHLFEGAESDMARRPVFNLSVGQQQRIAAARALIGSPALVIADEPTSSLDFDAREAFMELLLREVEENQSTLLFVSHDHSLQAMFDRVLRLEEFNHGGRL